jgi:hypothetical protein
MCPGEGWSTAKGHLPAGCQVAALALFHPSHRSPCNIMWSLAGHCSLE